MAAIRVVDLKAPTSAAPSPGLLVDADTGRSALKRATLCIAIAGAFGTPAAKRLLRLRGGGILHLA
jgi:molybdopterin/thiamine biosynthesis adenylyltransferase